MANDHNRMQCRRWQLSKRSKITFHVINWLSGPLPHAWAFTSFTSSKYSSPPVSWNNNYIPAYSPFELNRSCSKLRSVNGDDVEDISGNYFDDDGLPPLFADQSTINRDCRPSHSMKHAIERVRKRLFSSSDEIHNDTNNDNLLKKIVQLGITYQVKQQASKVAPDRSRSFHSKERVPGCIATVHLRTALIPISSQSTVDPKNYHVILSGSADAMLSGGLLAILADVIGVDDEMIHTSEGFATADDVLHLNPDNFTSTIGLQSVLSRGRNDGMASMIRLVQRQIKSMLGEEHKFFGSPGDVLEVDDNGLSKLLKTSFNNTGYREDTTHKPSVAMLLSGGVDSSVALHLLLRQNYNASVPGKTTCTSAAVCEHAGNVPLEIVSLGKEYREQVVQYTIDEAQRGRTPNPDIMCNSRVKFGCFLDYIDNNGMEFDFIASGHYARLEDETPTNGMQLPQKRLFRAPDPIKDQSYFLCALTQRQLSKILFPIGTYQKSEVRALATHFQLPNRNRPDSQGLCFLGKVRFDDFLESYLGKRPGDVVDALNGEVIGHHNGLWYHTVGQRKGIGKVISPFATARGPWYVVAKDQKRDIVYVSNRYDEEDFAGARSDFEVEDVRWISGEPPADTHVEIGSERNWIEVKMDMKIRHGPKIVQGTLLLKENGSIGNVRLNQKDGGLAPGQYVVFYRASTDECLGAGIISERHWANFLKNIDVVAGQHVES
ncbi:hypothetical protein ACHAWU_003572 [Discostella pseudostelligera]|uniref:tRNA-5-taurinomethyluridine 2-sulfurtransferase n=1 Tax=Discostella pseudostelligera TaxID=259834 RepID=A0ABD3N2Z2_9STRA